MDLVVDLEDLPRWADSHSRGRTIAGDTGTSVSLIDKALNLLEARAMLRQ